MERIPVEIDSAVVDATATVYYTTPAYSTTTINNLSLTNTNAPAGATVTATLHRVPDGGSPSPANMILNAFPIIAGRTIVPAQAIGLQMKAGTTLQALASVAGVIALTAGGYETKGIS